MRSRSAGYTVAPSDANFIFVDIRRDSRGFQEACRTEGVNVGRSFPPMLNWARISIGTKAEMEVSLPVFMKVLSMPPAATARFNPAVLDATAERADLGRAMAHTRRQFLERLGHSAGAAMTYEAMVAMGLMAVPARAAARARSTDKGSGTGARGRDPGRRARRHVDRLRAHEARIRRRAFSRRGRGPADAVTRFAATRRREEKGASGTCAIRRGPVLQPRPDADSASPHGDAGYCRELGVPVEVFVNDNDAAYLYQTKRPARWPAGACAAAKCAPTWADTRRSCWRRRRRASSWTRR